MLKNNQFKIIWSIGILVVVCLTLFYLTPDAQAVCYTRECNIEMVCVNVINRVGTFFGVGCGLANKYTAIPGWMCGEGCGVGAGCVNTVNGIKCGTVWACGHICGWSGFIGDNLCGFATGLMNVSGLVCGNELVCKDVWAGDCTAGTIETRSCGSGGTQTRICRNWCNWSKWSECENEGCSPGDVQFDSCGNCGTTVRWCKKDYSWSSWADCYDEGVCRPDATEECGSGKCGTKTCGSDCNWSDCQLKSSSLCWTGDTRACLNNGIQRCTLVCKWGACNSSCSCDAPVNSGCGKGSCEIDEMQITRNCTPSKCDWETDCQWAAVCNHLECNDSNQCVQVPGQGLKTCSNNSDCGGQNTYWWQWWESIPWF